MLFCNLTQLDGNNINANVFCRKSEFCELITSLHIQHSIYIRQTEFFVFTMKQITSIFVTFLLTVSILYHGPYILSCHIPPTFIYVSAFDPQVSK